MARLPRHGAKMNKVKIGTTIEVDTKAALDGLMQAAPDSLRTPGEAIDYIANIAMGLQPRVAKTVDTACMEQIRIIEKEMKLLPQDGSREMMWSDLEASRSQLKRLHEHFSSYYEQDGAPHELRRIELSDDAYALIPSDWIVLGTVDDAAECNKVGVVELDEEFGRSAPHFVFFHNGSYYKDKIIAQAARAWVSGCKPSDNPVAMDHERTPDDPEGITASGTYYFSELRNASFYETRGIGAPYGAAIYYESL